jgi:putative nucleotidyltransferase with HDIG domain
VQKVNCILKDPEYLSYLNKNREAEAGRVYCHHDMAHFLDVARIAYIISLEEKLNADKELLYAAGLLHDIGRWREYETGVDHALASRELAAGILQRCKFSETEIGEILALIASHRHKDANGGALENIFRRADKLSRNCAQCDAKATCRRFWNDEDFVLAY